MICLAYPCDFLDAYVAMSCTTSTLTFVFLLLARHNPSELGILLLLRASVLYDRSHMTRLSIHNIIGCI